MIRRAMEKDAEDIARIYNQAINKEGVYANSLLKPVTVESRLQWIREHVDPYPAFVYEGPNGEVIGFSALSPFSVRPEYRTIAEYSRYVDEAHRSKRIGQALAAHLMGVARQLGFRAIVALVFEKNRASIQSARRFGSREIGTLLEVSKLREEWLNDTWMYKDLTFDEVIELPARAD